MARTYEYTGINDSTTIVMPAGSELKAPRCKAYKVSEGALVLPGAGEVPVGIALNTQDDDLMSGDDVTIQVKDIGLWLAGAVFAAGDLLATDAEGLCQKATEGQFIFARALEEATKKNDLVRVQIINAGYVPTASSGVD